MRLLHPTVLVVVASTLLLGQARPAPETVLAAGSHVVPPPRGYHFSDGQTYVFSVQWHMFTAGVANVKIDRVGAEQRVSTWGDSTGFVNSVYKIHDRAESFFDPKTFCSLRVNKHVEEGRRKRDAQIRFDYAQRKSILDESNLNNGEVKHVLNDIPGCVTDVVSGFFYVGSLPLQPGFEQTFPVNDGGKTVDVRATVEAREQIKVPAGTFQTIRVKAEPESGPLKGKAAVSVWYTADANHTPVQMRSKLGWGALTFRLQRIEK